MSRASFEDLAQMEKGRQPARAKILSRQLTADDVRPIFPFWKTIGQDEQITARPMLGEIFVILGDSSFLGWEFQGEEYEFVF
jgi:hypothetical protein